MWRRVQVTAARSAAATLDAQQRAAVVSLTKALAAKRNAEMAFADERDAWLAERAELLAQLEAAQQRR